MALQRENRIAWTVLALCFLYASLRYAAFGATSPNQLPAWILNKALALSSAIALALAIRAHLRERADACRRYLTAFGRQALLHVIITLALFSPAYFQNLYAHERLGALGEWAILGGALTAVTLGRPRDLSRAGLTAGFLALLIHLAALGGPGWAHPGTWPKAMPPLTLLGFLVAAAALAMTRSMGKHGLAPSPAPGPEGA
jgi:hypothetical protein